MHKVVSDDMGSDAPNAKRISFFYHPSSVNHPKHKQNDRFRYARLVPRKYPKAAIK